MAIKTIANGLDTPVNKRTGTIPDVSDGMRDWFQPMTFKLITKTTEAFQVVETPEPVDFRGVIQPFTDRQLYLRPEGERAWTWYMLHADPVLPLKVDDVVVYNGLQTRVVSLRHYDNYGFIQYALVEDWRGSGPEAVNVLSYGVLQYGMEMPGA